MTAVLFHLISHSCKPTFCHKIISYNFNSTFDVYILHVCYISLQHYDIISCSKHRLGVYTSAVVTLHQYVSRFRKQMIIFYSTNYIIFIHYDDTTTIQLYFYYYLLFRHATSLFPMQNIVLIISGSPDYVPY